MLHQADHDGPLAKRNGESGDYDYDHTHGRHKHEGGLRGVECSVLAHKTVAVVVASKGLTNECSIRPVVVSTKHDRANTNLRMSMSPKPRVG